MSVRYYKVPGTADGYIEADGAWYAIASFDLLRIPDESALPKGLVETDIDDRTVAFPVFEDPDVFGEYDGIFTRISDHASGRMINSGDGIGSITWTFHCTDICWLIGHGDAQAAEPDEGQGQPEGYMGWDAEVTLNRWGEVRYGLALSPKAEERTYMTLWAPYDDIASLFSDVDRLQAAADGKMLIVDDHGGGIRIDYLCGKVVSMGRDTFSGEENLHGTVGRFLVDRFPEMRGQFGYVYGRYGG